MQIGRNPSPHPFKLGKSFFPAAPQGLVGTLAFADVADNPCEIAVAVAAEFAEGDLQWNLMTVPNDLSLPPSDPREARRKFKEPPVHLKPASNAAEALNRIEMPKEAVERISELLIPGSSLVVSDEGLGRETGRYTEFIVLTR